MTIPTRHRAVLSFRPCLLRVAVVSALGVYASMLSGKVHASCQGEPVQNISGNFTYGYVICQGSSRSDGQSVSYTTDGTFKIDASDDRGLDLAGNVGGVLTLYSRGGDGVDEHNAGAGGTAYLKNSADMRLSGTTHAGFYKSLISVSSIGGNGDDHNDDNNSDGGDGGSGNALNIENNGALTIDSTVQPYMGSTFIPLFGISAVSGGGTGGDQNDSAFGNQVGGPGGSGGGIAVRNNGAIVIGTPSARVTGYVRGAGIHAESYGGSGGTDNGAAGGAGVVNIANTGSISVAWNAQDGLEVYGIHAISAAGEGSESHDTSDDGGAGGQADSVIVQSSGEILVDLMDAAGSYTGEGAGIAALSRGGKGGVGPKADHAGGKGGAGQSITVSLDGANSRVTTRGKSLYGILAQSLGGQGGDGKDAAAIAGQGGGAGLGGDASSVAVSLGTGASIETEGAYSTAIIAQSVGGGGGTGGAFVSVLGGQGGNGGSGGDSSAVGVNAAGTITTRGHHAYGLLAQSIAGSGGAGGIEASAVVSLGGDGAGGGEGGDVSVVHSGGITTSGYAGHGIVAQSIGGGGGASGSSIGLLSVGGSATGATGSQGGKVSVTNVGRIQTSNAAAAGIVAQSIGGGGGSSGDSLGVMSIGGSGAAGGDGGYVGIFDVGTIETSGKFSPGILAQSIGGGGGNGGDAFAISTGVTVAVGGQGAGGGNGGAVCLSSQGACDDSVSEHTREITTHGSYSPGIIAQNIGGGGGSGGSVTAASVASFVGMQLGGSGAGGGNAGAAGTLVNYRDMTIRTGGTHASGILAQSIGGGGGSGGDASYYNATVGFNAALVMGGSGDTGGSGAATKVILENSHIATGMDYATTDRDTYAPNESFGILAQSIGGGGGSGGNASAATFIVAVPLSTPMPPVSFNFETALGGSGGGGGNACPSGDSSCLTQVALTDGSSVTTLGDGSHAVVAQSIGGGGGAGGDSSALSIGVGYGDSVSGALAIALGGKGGAASHGGMVDVALGDAGASHAALPTRLPDLTEPLMAPGSSILTYGDYANGVLAQSVGGGGGNGGSGASDAYSIGGFGSVAVTLGLGGPGGEGGNGGQVTTALNPNFVIHTAGSGSRGMVAQSIGGGGGTSQGGTIALAAGAKSVRGMLSLNIGREGGEGGDSNRVATSIDGAIRTEGGDADGVLLQAIGGGGGLGGSVGADASAHPILDRIGASLIRKERLDDGGGAYEFNVSLGGIGGKGGKGGEVSLDFSGKIATQGDWADGIVAQSIGGGGGTGGSSTAAGSRVKASVNLAVGGKGGSGGDAGRVSANFNGSYQSSIRTEGYRAYGVLLQSIGGGGGQGGDGSDRANGEIAVGGSNGGSGGTAGVGGAVEAGAGSKDWVTLETLGSDALGFTAQSIGGGGGVGGAGNSDAAVLADSHSIDLSVGGRGGHANHAGRVSINLGASLTTHGDRSHGFVAQSVGGGGGIGGAGHASKLSSVGLGGRGGAGGDGAAVSFVLTPNSYVSTHGAGAHGVIAQSIGGGGGLAGDTTQRLEFDVDGWLAADEGGRGSGHEVNVTVTNSQIITRGEHAFGLVAQSLGGGGGLAGSAQGGYAGSTAGKNGTGSGGAVNVVQSGAITAAGNNATGIFAQSAGPDGAGVVNVKVDGEVSGGTGQHGHAVWIAQGRQNLLNVGPTGQVVAGSGGSAVRYDGRGDELSTLGMTVSGLLSGNIECNNASGGAAGCHVAVLEGGELRDANLYEANVNNAGTVVMAKRGGFERLTIAGNYVQQPEGVLVAGVDFVGHRAGQMKVQGDAALDGKLQLAATSLLPDRELTVLAVDGKSTGKLEISESAIFDFALKQVGNEQRVSVRGADFTIGSPDLEADQRGVAHHLQDAWNRSGSEELGRLFAVLHDAASGQPQTYRDRLMDLSPGNALAPAEQMAAGMGNFMGQMMSCQSKDGRGAGGRERDCVWGQVTRRNMDHDAGNGVPGFSFDTTTYQFGGQRAFQPTWFMGASFAYQNSRLKGNTGRVNANGDTGYAGIVLKHQAGPWLYSGSLAGGYGSFKLNRSLAVDDYERQSSASPKVYSVGARLRAARTIELSEQLYLKPYVDLDALYTRMPGYTESAGALGLQVDGSDQFVLSLSPMIEFGGNFDTRAGATLRPYAYAGVSLKSKDSWSTVSRLRGAPPGTAGISTTLAGDKVVGRFGLGVQLNTKSGLDVRLQYDGEASRKTRSHAGQLKVMYRF